MSNEAQVALAGPHGQQAAAFISLQNQLGETQASLSTQLDKIQQLEGQWREHEHLRNEITSLRNQVDTSRREMELLLARSSHDDDDDARSVITLMDSEEAAERVRSRRNLDVPGTPDPQTELVNRIQSLSAEIAEAVQLSRALQTQHAEAMTAVRQLTLRVGALEAGMAAQVAEQVGKAEQRWESWRAKCEEGWKRERESWESERERLRGVVREWEEASRRGHEEEEDRELNESLSGDDEQEDSLTDEDLPPGPTPVLRSKARRRRPSHRTTLAVRALKGVIDANGALTPKADVQTLDEPRAASTRLRVRELRNSSARRRSPRGDPNGKDSSESGRDSGDTLKESEKGVRKSKNSPPRPPLQASPTCERALTAADPSVNGPHGSCCGWSLVLEAPRVTVVVLYETISDVMIPLVSVQFPSNSTLSIITTTTTTSTLTMSLDYVRKLVSGNKARFVDSETAVDLDLVYGKLRIDPSVDPSDRPDHHVGFPLFRPDM